MDYNTFMTTVCENIQERRGEDYCVRVQPIPRNNYNENKAIVISRKPFSEQGVGAAFSMRPVYEEFQKGKSIEQCGDELLDAYEQEIKNQGTDQVTKLVRFLGDWEQVKQNLFPKLIQRENNTKFLEPLVHRPFMNLEICYYVRTKEQGIEGALNVSREYREMWNVSEEEIHAQAMSNLGKEGYKILSLTDQICELAGAQSDEFNEEEKEGPEFYVITNDNKEYAAAGILYNEFLKYLEEKVGNNFYLLPSSVHELILLPDDSIINKDALKKMVMEINQEFVSEEERLSDSIYYYDIEKSCLSIVA